MEFFIVSKKSRNPEELVVLPFWEHKKDIESAASLGKYESLVKTPLIKKDFQGKEGELLFLYDSVFSNRRVVLLGLGDKEKISIESLRRIYAQLVKACHHKKIEELVIFLPQTKLTEEMTVTGLAEGLLLTNYAFDNLKQKKEKSSLLKKIGLVGVSKKGLEKAKYCREVAEGVYLARDLVNGNADDINPQYLSRLAKEMARNLPVKATILNKKQIEKEKLGLLLAVNRGSTSEPALIILTYRGNPRSKEHTVLIGKGITYDTGGLNLKPTTSMETMKADMAGAAAVFGTLYVAATLRFKTNLSIVVPATENSIGPNSFKPGDVYPSLGGLTVEITNPDAEGRLVLADAIAYARKKLHPTRIIDIATLTGGIDVALGSEACGVYVNQEALADTFFKASENTFERVWRMPLFEEYRDHLKSDIADMKNSAGRSASSNTAALFLQEFVGQVPWAHLDIAGVAYLSEKKRYHPKYGTGFGVRLLVELLRLQSN